MIMVIQYSRYFICHYLLGGRLKKKIDIGFTNDRMRKINNSFKIPINKSNIIISYSYESY